MQLRPALDLALAATLALLAGTSCSTPTPDRSDASQRFPFRGGEIALTRQGTDCRLSLKGEINPTTVSALTLANNALIERVCDRRTLALDVHDGQVGAAITIGSMLRNRNIDTQVPPGSTCQTACLLVFAAGTQRELARGTSPARLGFSQIPPDEDFGQTTCYTELSNRQLLNLARYLKTMLPRSAADYVLDEIRSTDCRGVREVPAHKALSSGLATRG